MVPLWVITAVPIRVETNSLIPSGLPDPVILLPPFLPPLFLRFMPWAVAISVAFAFVASFQSDATAVNAVPTRLLMILLISCLFIDINRRLSHQKIGSQLLSFLNGGSLIVYTLFVYVAQDYPQIVRINWQLDRWVLVDDLILIAPLVMTVMSAWATQVCPQESVDGWSRLQCATSSVRHFLLLPLAPILLVLIAADLAHFVTPGDHKVEAFAAVAAIGAFLLLAPFLLRICWKTEPFPSGPVRNELESIFTSRRLGIRDIRVWQTNSRIANAILTGILPRCRFLFLSDELVHRVKKEKLKAIVAHEAGHIRHAHLMQLLLSLQVPFLSMLFLRQAITHGKFAPDTNPWFGMSALLLGWLFIHARLARAFEHQADIEACYILADQTTLNPATVTTLGEALTRVAGGSSGSDWLHPSVVSRIAVLNYLAKNSGRERVFQRRLQQVRILLILKVSILLIGLIALLMI